MTKYTGKDLQVLIATTLVTANLVRSVTTNETLDKDDSSGASDVDKTYLGTLRDTQVSMDLLDDSTTSTLWALVEPAAAGVILKIYPQGSTAIGKPVLSSTGTGCIFLIENRTRGVVYNQTVPITVSGTVSGGLTEGVTT